MPRGRSDEAPGGRHRPLLTGKPTHEPNPAAETFDEWFARFLKTKECGASYRRITGNILAKWVSPVIGPKPVRGLTRDDIEDVRDRLDRALDAKEIRHTTARNAWSAFIGGLKAAYAAIPLRPPMLLVARLIRTTHSDWEECGVRLVSWRGCTMMPARVAMS
jgi:hypothetical protein